MSSPAGRIRHRVTRIEETLRRLLGRAPGGGGSGDDGFAPWKPPSPAQQARWDRESAELEALIERIERAEASAAELDGVEAMLRRLEGEREVEEARMERTRRVLAGDGTMHGRAPMGLSCACGVCEDYRREGRS
jgi:hypothetical protein